MWQCPFVWCLTGVNHSILSKSMLANMSKESSGQVGHCSSKQFVVISCTHNVHFPNRPLFWLRRPNSDNPVSSIHLECLKPPHKRCHVRMSFFVVLTTFLELLLFYLVKPLVACQSLKVLEILA